MKSTSVNTVDSVVIRTKVHYYPAPLFLFYFGYLSVYFAMYKMVSISITVCVHASDDSGDSSTSTTTVLEV